MFDQRQGGVLGHRQRGEQRTALVEHTKPPFQLRAALGRQAQQFFTEHPHGAGVGAAQAEDAAQQN